MWYSFNSCTRPIGQPDAFYSISNSEKEQRLKDGTECLLLLALARGLTLPDDIVAVVLSVSCLTDRNRAGVLTCACRGPRCAASAA
jgi:hypothetical protein